MKAQVTVTKVLWVAAADPANLRTGLEVYSYSLLAGLRAQPGVEVDLFLLEPDLRISRFGKALSLLTRKPAMCHPWQPTAVRAKLCNTLGRIQYDAVFLDHIQTTWLLPEILKSGCATVYLSQNHESSNYADWRYKSGGNALRCAAYFVDGRKVQNLEKRVVERVTAVTAITNHDIARFRADGVKNLFLIPPALPPKRDSYGPITSSTQRRVLHFGSYEWATKVESLRALIRIAEEPFRQSEITLTIAGPGDPSKVAKLSGVSHYVQFVGRVPESLLSELWDSVRCAIVFEPVGGGFKMKLLTLATAGVPIFTLRRSIQDLPLIDGQSCMVFESPEDLVDGVVKHIDDFDLLNSLAKNAAEAIEASGFNTVAPMKILLDLICPNL